MSLKFRFMCRRIANPAEQGATVSAIETFISTYNSANSASSAEKELKK
jgi:hypothetical protein